jgi:RNA polymerase sigma-70 factor, ECF subfamily
VDEHLPRVYRFALRLTGSRQEAEDLTQDTFLRAWRQRGRLRDAGAARVWLFTIARNLWTDRLRRKRRRPVSIEALQEDCQSAAIAADRGLIVQEDVRRVLEAMDSLPARQRELLHLHACEGLSLGEIAEVVGISVDAAKASLCEARKRMRERFREIDCGACRGESELGGA